MTEASASAPGKIVLWGEYAVLHGAPAAVMAVDRLATCQIRTADDGVWRMQSRGFESQAEANDLTTLLQQPGTEVLRAAIEADFEAPAPLHITCDSSSFYEQDRKLGIGSSAAVMVALSGALGAIRRDPPKLADVLSAHRALQGGVGSGLDIATSFTGGIIRFQSGEVSKITWSQALQYQFVATPQAASTPDLVGKFERWRTRSDSSSYATLMRESEALFEEANQLSAWRRYSDALHAFDQAADLGIYTATHAALRDQAGTLDFVYKPCGAGGGDVGMVIAPAAESLQPFLQRATALGATPLSCRLTEQGLQVEHR